MEAADTQNLSNEGEPQYLPDETTSLLAAANYASQAANGAVPQVATGNQDAPVDDAEIENPDRPKGIKFAIVFACLLMGDFFVGYVRHESLHEMHEGVRPLSPGSLRTPAA